MNITTVTSVFFSPTSTTKKVVREILRGINPSESTEIDITLSSERKNIHPINPDDLIVIGIPVYAGRVPGVAADYTRKMKAQGNPVVLVVVYGNREFEDALLELHDLSKACNMVPVAAGAFIGEHSFSTKNNTIAADRPDNNDLKIAHKFGTDIKEKLSSLKTLGGTSLTVPGNRPYRDGLSVPSVSFIGVADNCIECGVCLQHCPVDAIDGTNRFSSTGGLCIHCCACVKVCPQDARSLKDGPVKDTALRLYHNCQEYQKPEVFI